MTHSIEFGVLVLRLTCRTEASFSASLTCCPTCLTQLFPRCTSRARWPMRGGGALLTVIALWAKELGGGPLWASFQTVKPLREVFIDKFKKMFLYLQDKIFIVKTSVTLVCNQGNVMGIHTDMNINIIVFGRETEKRFYQYSTSRTDRAVSQPLQTFLQAISPCRAGHSYTSHTVMTWGEKKHAQVNTGRLTEGKAI